MNEMQQCNWVLFLTAAILFGFGAFVVVWSIISWARGQSARMLWVRYLVWFAILPPLILPLVYSRIGFQLVIVALSLLCFREYSRVTGLWHDRRLIAICYITILFIFFPVIDAWYGLYAILPVYAMGFVLAEPIMRDEYEHMIQKICLAVLGVLYFGWFFSHLAYMRNVTNGIVYIFLAMVLVESNDAFAYLWGKLLGKHKLAPRISPNKTIEGAIGAMISVVALALGLRFLIPFVTTLHIILLAFQMSVFGMCGDLVLSYIKRDVRIKDTGNIIPGHGGLLDRFDSIIFCAPLFFHFMRYFYGGMSYGW